MKKVEKKPETQNFEAKIAELTNDLQRTRADFENYRKQIELQKENEKKAAKVATIYTILPLLDDLERAISSYQDLAPLTGTFNKKMKELGIEKIASGVGVDFNPDIHEAIAVEGEGEKEVISECLRNGYYYNGEVIRPAMVKVKKT